MLRHRGFSFAEVMFAVVILGVGFIMVASIFPVAAQQTRSNNDQSMAAQLARDAFKTIASCTVREDYGGDAGAIQILSQECGTSKVWDQITYAMISPVDKRYACVPLFSKAGPADPIGVTIIVVRRFLHDGYTTDDQQSGKDLDPRGININKIAKQSDGTDLVEIARDAYSQTVASGAYMIITSGGSNITAHIFQIGEYKGESADSVLWSLVPTSNLAADEGCDDGAKAYIIGRDIDDSTPVTSYVGPAQDVSVFRSYINPK